MDRGYILRDVDFQKFTAKSISNCNILLFLFYGLVFNLDDTRMLGPIWQLEIIEYFI